MALFAGPGSLVFRGSYQKLHDCSFADGALAVLDSVFAMEVRSCSVSVRFDNNSSDVLIIDNLISGLTGDTVDQLMVVGNIFRGGGIDIGGSAPVITGNKFLGQSASHVITLVACENGVIANNHIVRRSGSQNTFDGIHLDDDCLNNLVDHNQITSRPLSSLRYGVYAPAGNFVVGNALGTPADYGTAPIGGSPTTTYPGGAYGDNFTV